MGKVKKIVGNIGLRIVSNHILNLIVQNPVKVQNHRIGLMRIYGSYTSQFKPGIGKGAKAISKVDDIVDAVGFVNKYDNVIVLGQSMGKRIIPYADEIGAIIYKGLSNFDDLKDVYGLRKASWLGYIDNMGFVISNSLSGAKFIDKGFDTTRSIKAAKMLGK